MTESYLKKCAYFKERFGIGRTDGEDNEESQAELDNENTPDPDGPDVQLIEEAINNHDDEYEEDVRHISRRRNEQPQESEALLESVMALLELQKQQQKLTPFNSEDERRTEAREEFAEVNDLLAARKKANNMSTKHKSKLANNVVLRKLLLDDTPKESLTVKPPVIGIQISNKSKSHIDFSSSNPSEQNNNGWMVIQPSFTSNYNVDDIADWPREAKPPWWSHLGKPETGLLMEVKPPCDIFNPDDFPAIGGSEEKNEPGILSDERWKSLMAASEDPVVEDESEDPVVEDDISTSSTYDTVDNSSVASGVSNMASAIVAPAREMKLSDYWSTSASSYSTAGTSASSSRSESTANLSASKSPTTISTGNVTKKDDSLDLFPPLKHKKTLKKLSSSTTNWRDRP